MVTSSCILSQHNPAQFKYMPCSLPRNLKSGISTWTHPHAFQASGTEVLNPMLVSYNALEKMSVTA